MDDRSTRIAALVTPTIESLGYEVVRVLVSGSQRPTLQIMAERADGQPMTVEDCATLSRGLSPVLDVDDPIIGAYVLEVSSPGLDRPLTRLKDFVRFAGQEARLEVREALEGRKRFRGVLQGVEGTVIHLLTAEGEKIAVPFALLQRAKLVLTDALIAASLAGHLADAAAEGRVVEED